MFIAVALILLISAGFAIAAKFGLLTVRHPEEFRKLVEHVRNLPHARLSFVFIYAVAAASGVPATALTISGGVIFGPVLGIVLNWTSDMLAAVIAFGIARASAGWFAQKRMDNLDIQRARGFLGLLRLRVIPVVPFAALNYGAAIYGMKWRTFLAATGVGIMPSTVVYTLLASSLATGVAGAGRKAFLMTGLFAVCAIVLSMLPGVLSKYHSAPVER